MNSEQVILILLLVGAGVLFFYKISDPGSSPGQTADEVAQGNVSSEIGPAYLIANMPYGFPLATVAPNLVKATENVSGEPFYAAGCSICGG